MPAKPPPLPHTVAEQLSALGQQIRARRKALGVSATAAAEAASMSRVTLHRIEKGEPSVTMGAWCNAMAALGMDLHARTGTQEPPATAPDRAGWIPARVALADYPQLRALAWQVHGTDTLTPAEALGIYERNARHLDMEAMPTHERALLDALRLALQRTAQSTGASDAV